jgi:hypothetical protein
LSDFFIEVFRLSDQRKFGDSARGMVLIIRPTFGLFFLEIGQLFNLIQVYFKSRAAIRGQSRENCQVPHAQCYMTTGLSKAKENAKWITCRVNQLKSQPLAPILNATYFIIVKRIEIIIISYTIMTVLAPTRPPPSKKPPSCSGTH